MTRRSSAPFRSTSMRVRRSSCVFGALCECLLQQPAEPVLLALNPEDVLNLLPSTRARNLGV